MTSIRVLPCEDERLLIRPVSGRDEADLFDIYVDPEVMLFASDPVFHDIEAVRRTIASIQRNIDTGEALELGIVLKIAPTGELGSVRAFYERAGYGGGASEADRIFLANVDGRPVGVVRLCEEGGVIVLRGMHIDPAYQRKGIGSALLLHCAPHLDRGAAYCLPYAHLAPFYGQAGFVPVHAGATPDFLGKRLAAYRASGRQVLAMHRTPSGQAAARIS